GRRPAPPVVQRLRTRAVSCLSGAERGDGQGAFSDFSGASLTRGGTPGTGWTEKNRSWPTKRMVSWSRMRLGWLASYTLTSPRPRARSQATGAARAGPPPRPPPPPPPRRPPRGGGETPPRRPPPQKPPPPAPPRPPPGKKPAGCEEGASGPGPRKNPLPAPP